MCVYMGDFFLFWVKEKSLLNPRSNKIYTQDVVLFFLLIPPGPQGSQVSSARPKMHTQFDVLSKVNDLSIGLTKDPCVVAPVDQPNWFKRCGPLPLYHMVMGLSLGCD